VRSALANVTEPTNDAKRKGPADIHIDWSKVKSTGGWLRSVDDLPDEAPAKLKHIIGHTGNLKELNEDLIELGLITKGYGSWLCKNASPEVSRRRDLGRLSCGSIFWV